MRNTLTRPPLPLRTHPDRDGERERYNSDRRREKMECGGREKKRPPIARQKKKIGRD